MTQTHASITVIMVNLYACKLHLS